LKLSFSARGTTNGHGGALPADKIPDWIAPRHRVPSAVVMAARRFAWGGEEALLDQRAFNGKTKGREVPRRDGGRPALGAQASRALVVEEDPEEVADIPSSGTFPVRSVAVDSGAV